jgi:hypothetical protein
MEVPISLRTDRWCRDSGRTQLAFDGLFVADGRTVEALLRLRKTYAGSVLDLQDRRPEESLGEIAAVGPNMAKLLGFGSNSS